MENEKCRLDLFYELLRIRRVEEEIARRYEEQKMRCPMHLSIGQEAIAVGVCKALDGDDLMISHHRCHAHYLAKGGNLDRMIAELHGKKTGCSFGRAGSMHLVDLEAKMYGSTAITGNAIPIGVGLALASSMKKEPHLTTIFFGDGATEEGTFGESLNFASLKNLPLLFICENNLYSMHARLSDRQSERRDRVKIAEANGLYAKKGDGNDVEEVFALAQAATTRIRAGKGPAFIEFDTYRFRSHSGASEESHRSQEEVNAWKEQCPLKVYEKKLLDRALLTEETLKTMEVEIEGEIARAFSFAEESPFPEFDLDYEKPYAE
ncbi:MAG: Acetoin:2,6-dichlorophenolindophenol oxidoreductase subunit alpha [Chlamydiae bacterium]|nr:Acetoin:2,6-dichlorophenolindophenol oxidoreductase subunit alpha [Chlamydiota bacterium]